MNKEPKDKRTKAWKEWKENFDKENSIGLGDVIEKVTEVTGIKKAVEFIAGEDCGCNERKQKANKTRFRFPVVRCFTESQFNQWTEFRKLKGNITREQQTQIIIPIYRQLFVRQLPVMSCCIQPYIDEIDKVYKTYE
jgi:hypothetical protein